MSATQHHTHTHTRTTYLETCVGCGKSFWYLIRWPTRPKHRFYWYFCYTEFSSAHSYFILMELCPHTHQCRIHAPPLSPLPPPVWWIRWLILCWQWLHQSLITLPMQHRYWFHVCELCYQYWVCNGILFRATNTHVQLWLWLWNSKLSGGMQLLFLCHWIIISYHDSLHCAYIHIV